MAVLFKLRLTSLVVFSAALGYLMGAQSTTFNWAHLLLLILAGTLITGASNAFNQVIEVREDSLMSRTNERPMVRGSLSTTEAIAISSFCAALGTFILWMTFGGLTAVLGFLALFMYVALYTPMKKISPWSVFVGAFPGAIPPMLGYVAAIGHFGLGPGLMFAVQFMWQFVHFWAIAWVLDDDYRKAGFLMLPSKGGRNGSSAFLILLYGLFVIPVGMLPWAFGITGSVSMVIAVLAGLYLLYPAVQLFISKDKVHARKLMFASFVYLPVVQLAYVFDTL